jgi:hypothetical protein
MGIAGCLCLSSGSSVKLAWGLVAAFITLIKSGNGHRDTGATKVGRGFPRVT